MVAANKAFRYVCLVSMLVACGLSIADQPNYSESSKVLELPVVKIGGNYYFGVRIKLNSISVLGGPSGVGTCDPGSNLDLAKTPDFSCFSSQNAFDDALVGKWSTADGVEKITLNFSADGSVGTGTFAVYRTPQSDTSAAKIYHNCQFALSPTGATPESGSRPYALESILCDEGVVPLLYSTNLPMADMLNMNAYGGNNKIERLVIGNVRASGFTNVTLTRVTK